MPGLRLNAVVLALVTVFGCAAAGSRLASLKEGWQWVTNLAPRRELQQADEDPIVRRLFSFRLLVRNGLTLEGIKPFEDERSAAARTVREQTADNVVGLLIQAAPEKFPNLQGLKPRLVVTKEDTVTRSGGIPEWTEQAETRSGQTWNTTSCDADSRIINDYVEMVYEVESQNTTLQHALELYKITVEDLTSQVLLLTPEICGIISLGFTWVDVDFT